MFPVEKSMNISTGSVTLCPRCARVFEGYVRNIIHQLADLVEKHPPINTAASLRYAADMFKMEEDKE